MISVFLRRRTVVAVFAAVGVLGSVGGAWRAQAAPAAAAGAGRASVMSIAWTISAADVGASCARAIERVRRRVDAVVNARTARTFASVVVPLEAASADFNDELAAQTFLYNVSTDAAVRAASLKCATDAGNAYADLSARPDLERALEAAAASKTARGEAQQKLTSLWVSALKRNGAGLPADGRAQFVALHKKLNADESRYASNLGEDRSAIEITAAQAASLPADFVAAALTKTAGGGYRVPVNEATAQPFMQNETDAAARKAYYLSYNDRGGTANVRLLEDAIAVRAQLAHLLGYPTWAAYVLSDRMAGTPQRVEDFLGQLDAAILPKARAERAEDAALKGGPLDPWDSAYYENVLRKTKYSLDQNAVKQYFPVQHVVDSVLGIYQELLGVRFTRVDVPVWESHVTAYDVADAASGAPLGRFYLDLFPRPGKYDHFANFPIVPRRVLSDGSVRLAESAIVGNWPQAAPGRPALLQHGDVVVFFHEFGHCMAAMLADEPYETLTSGFRRDFIEAPSQMLENFAWDPGILKRVSANVETGAPLPDALIEKIVATRYVHYALATTQQILYATVDMAYHTETPPVDTTAVWMRTAAATTPATFVEGTHPQAAFGHLMSGYDAGYYGYLWSLVYAQDIFTRFRADGLTNPAVGAAYRRDILAPARAEEPDQEVRAFLGRPMRPDAFYAELGIAPPAAAAAR